MRRGRLRDATERSSHAPNRSRLQLRMVARLSSNASGPTRAHRERNRRRRGRARNANRVRQRAAFRARPRRTCRAWMGRETYEPDRARFGIVRVSRRGRDHARVSRERAQQEDVRHVRALREVMSDGRVTRRLHDRRAPLYRGPHAANRRDPARTTADDRRLGLGLRPLPRCVPADATCGYERRFGFRTDRRRRRNAAARRALATAKRHLQASLRADGDGVARCRRASSQRCRRARERARPIRGARARPGTRYGPARASTRTCRMGARAHRVAECARRARSATRWGIVVIRARRDRIRPRHALWETLACCAAFDVRRALRALLTPRVRVRGDRGASLPRC